MERIKYNNIKILVFSLLIILSVNTSEMNAQGWVRQFTDSTIYQYHNLTALSPNGNVVQGQSLMTQDFKLLSVDSDGVLLWQKQWIPSNIDSFVALDMLVASDNGIVIGGFAENTPNPYPVLLKTDLNGNDLWNVTLGINSTINYIVENDNGDIICIGRPKIIQTPDTKDFFFMVVSKSGTLIMNKIIQLPSNYGNPVLQDIEMYTDQDVIVTLKYDDGNPLPGPQVIGLLKIDINGNIQSTITIGDGIVELRANKTKIYPNGDYLVAYEEYIGSTIFRLRKITSNGTIIWDKAFPQLIDDVYDMKIDKDGEIYMVGDYNLNQDAYICKTDSVGVVIWSKVYQHQLFYNSYNTTRIDIDPDGNCYIGGSELRNVNPGSIRINSITKLNGHGNIYSGFIKGKVVLDQNQNCIQETTDLAIPNYEVIAYKNSPFLEFTDTLGNYLLNVDTGFVEIKTIPNNPINTSCGGPVTILVMPNDTVEVDFLENPSALCPYMVVDISTPFLRRCTTNTYAVRYCNNGSAKAYDVQLAVELDQYLTVLSSSIPWVSQTGNTFLFDLDSVDIFECNSFTILTELDCDSTVLGQTHCVEAHIYPDSLCIPPTNAWDGSITELNVVCQFDSVLFEIKNIGTGNMATPQGFIVTEDNIIRSSNTYQLQAGEVLSFKYPSNGKTYRLAAFQAPGYFPSDYIPTIAIEGCGYDPISNTYSTGFITQFNEDDGLHYLSIDCQENIGPYDPNDKRAEPKGYGTEHFINENTDIEYHIRFQNVGTDTAFKVVIRDQLSPHLDITKLQLGASSHPYDFSFVNGDIMKFTFNDIKLVDSTTNEPGSHGFIKFKIAQQPNIPLGTVINNSAGIYFDFNEPIITNTTFHKIGVDFVQILLNTEINSYPALEVKVYPNPFSEVATIELIDGPTGKMWFSVYDALGKTILTDQFEDRYKLARGHLTSGIYFFTISLEHQVIRQGKLVVN